MLLMINDFLQSCQLPKPLATCKQINGLLLEVEMGEHFTLLWAHGVHTEITVFICLVKWEIHMMCDGEERIEALAMQRTLIYLDNLLIRHACHKKVLFVLVWVELDAVWYLSIGEAGDTLACGERESHCSRIIHRGFAEGALKLF